MPKPNTLEICRRYLFEDPVEALSSQMQSRLLRIRTAYTHWVEFPMKSDNEIRDFIMDYHDCAKSQAYEDISIIKILLGNITIASKDWQRYTVIEMLKEAYQLAKDKQDPKAMTLAADKLGKYNLLHLPEVDPISYDEIIPQPFEPTSDPTVIGIVPIKDIDKRIKKLKQKYATEIDENIQDVEYMLIDKSDEA